MYNIEEFINQKKCIFELFKLNRNRFEDSLDQFNKSKNINANPHYYNDNYNVPPPGPDSIENEINKLKTNEKCTRNSSCKCSNVFIKIFIV